MFSTAEKTSRHTTALQTKAAGTTFFRKAEGDTFFSNREPATFFRPAIQTKLSVSSPDDPQEKEAEAVADKVMAMTDASAVQPMEQDTGLSRKEEDEVQPMGISNSICCKEEEKKPQAKIFPLLQRYPDPDAGFDDGAAGGMCADCAVNRKKLSLHTSDVLQCSGRGPPQGAPPFEQTLSSSKGGGSALPGATRQFMESRFGADFSGVRVHTGSTAAAMSGQIHAQAFTHGNDIYFNNGKFAPHTSGGGHLLAHELTHTIQQGASKTSVAPKKIIQGKSIPPRSPDNKSDRIHLSGLHRLEEDVPSSEAQTLPQKPELSSWQVKPSGQLDAGAPIAPSPEIKTDRKEELPPEEEQKEPAIQPFVQRQQAPLRAARVHAANQPGTTTVNSAQQPGEQQQQISSLTYQQGRTPAEPMMVQDRGPPPVTVQRQATVQRSIVSDAISGMGSFLGCITEVWPSDIKRCALRKVQQGAMHIPGYRALRVVLGEDPITNERVVRNGHNLIEAAFDIMPFGNLVHQKLNEMQKLDAAAAWIDTQIARLEGLVNGLFAAFRTFWNNLDADSLTSPLETLSEGVGIVVDFISKLIDFAVEAATELLRMIKDWLLQKIVDFIREQTPAYPLLKVILGKDPITGEEVARNGTNILNALLELGGEEGAEQRKQMQETGSFQKVADYIDRGIAVFSGAYDQIVQGFRNIWNRVTIASLIDPVGTFRMIYNEFAEPVSKVWAFVREVGAAILRFIKDVLMRRLSAWAREQRGYPLITVIIGKDPFTDAVVPRSVENIIRGFMSLMEGGEEQFNQMKESGAIDRAAAEIDAAVERLNMTPAYIVQLFIDLWNSFSLNDLAHPIDAFMRIIARFGEPIMRLIAFVVEIIRIVIHVILQIMNFPFDLINNIITKAMMAIDLIKADPIGFLKNLLKAVKQGFMQFFDNILTHLWNGLKEWFLGEVTAAGIPIPTDFSVMGLITWLLAVLDITMEKVWLKLEERIGKPKVDRIKQMISMAQRVAGAAGEAMDFIRDVQERGFMAVIVDKIKEQLSNVWDMVMEAVKGFVMNQIINKMVTKLLSMLDPTGIMAVINSAIAIYSAIQSFIRYLRELLEIVNSFVEGTLEIAQGNTKKAADFLEGALASGIPIIIGFFANQVGLNLSERLGDALEDVRAWADRALTWLIDRLVTIVERLVEMGRSAVRAVLDWARGILGLEKPFTTPDNASHRIFYAESGDTVKLMLNPAPAGEYETAINGINLPPAPGDRVQLSGPISVPLKRNNQVAATIAIAAESDGKIGMAILKTEAIRAARHIDGLITSRKRTSSDPAQQAAVPGAVAGASEQTEDFSASLDGLASITKYLLSVESSGPIPVTPVPTYGGLQNGFATSMEVKPLTKLGTPGTGVEITSPDYEDLLLRRETPGGRSYYIAGHLLNNNLHGSGTTWQNLTPIVQSTNADHLHSVETKVKNAVEEDKILHYTVQVQYNIPEKTSLVQQIEAEPNWQTNSVLAEKHKILKAEARLPTKLVCTLKQVKADGTDLPNTDPEYKAEYNFSNVEINNTTNVEQGSLDNYYLMNATAVTFKTKDQLKLDANAFLASNPTGNYNSFYNTPANKVSIDHLNENDTEEIKKVFWRFEQLTAERSRIEALTLMQSWNSFMSERAAYTNGDLEPGDITMLSGRFMTKMNAVKASFLQAKQNVVNGITDPNTTWGSFKNEHGFFPKEGVFSDAEINNFRSNVFTPKMNQLKATPVPTN